MPVGPTGAISIRISRETVTWDAKFNIETFNIEEIYKSMRTGELVTN